MFGLNVFALISFVAISFCSVMLCKCGEGKRKRIMHTLCVMLLALNLSHYAPLSIIFKGKLILPVEFSSVASFAVPIITLAGFKKTKSWAAYSGIMAGFFYYITMIIAGGKIYAAYPPYEVYMSMFCHGTLFLCGVIGLKTSKIDPSDCYKLFIGICLVVLNASLLRPIADDGTRLFIYELLDGLYIRQVFPEALWGYLMPVYYVLLIGLVILSVRLFLRLNETLYKKQTAAAQGPHAVPATGGAHA